MQNLEEHSLGQKAFVLIPSVQKGWKKQLVFEKQGAWVIDKILWLSRELRRLCCQSRCLVITAKGGGGMGKIAGHASVSVPDLES